MPKPRSILLLAASIAALACDPIEASPTAPVDRVTLVSEGALLEGVGWPDAPAVTDAVVVSGKSAHLWSGRAAGAGPFRMKVRLVLPVKSGTGAGVRLGDSLVGFDGPGGRCFSEGTLFLGGLDLVDGSELYAREGTPFDVEFEREDTWLEVRVDGVKIYRSQIDDRPIGRIGLTAGTGELRVLDWWIEGAFTSWNPPESLWTVTDDRIDEFADPVLVGGRGGSLHAFVTGVTTLDGGRDATEVFERVRGADGRWGPQRSVAGRGLSQVVAWGGDAGPSLIAVRRNDEGTARGVALRLVDDAWRESPLAIDGMGDDEVGALLALRIRQQSGARSGDRRSMALLPSSDRASTTVDLLVEAPVDPHATPGAASSQWRRATLDGFERIAFLATPDGSAALGLRAGAVASLRFTGGAWSGEAKWPLEWSPAIHSSLVAHSARIDLLTGSARRERGLRRATLDGDAWRDAPNDLFPGIVGAVSGWPLADGRTAVLFEGGERARREHVLFGVLDAPAPVPAPAPAPAPESPAPAKREPQPASP